MICSLNLMPGIGRHLTQKTGHCSRILTRPPLAKAPACHALESQLLPRAPQASGPRPEMGKVWSLLRVWRSGLGSCVCPVGRGQAGGIREPESGKSQAHTCLCMQMRWGRRQFQEVTGCAQPRTHYWEEIRMQQKWEGSGSLSVLTLGNHISCPLLG